MAIDSLTNRIDQLTAPDGQMDLLPPQPAPAEEAPQDIMMTEEQPEFEPVAGLTTLLRKGVKAAVKKVEKPMLPGGADTGKVGSNVVIDESKGAAKAPQILQDAPKAPRSGKPSPTPEQKAQGVQQTVFNLDLIQDTDGVRQFIETTAKAFDADKLEKVSYKQIAEEMSAQGYDEAFIARVLDPSIKTNADPREAYKMLLAVTDAGKRAFDLGEQVKAAQAAGNLTPELAVQFHQAVALEGVLLKAAKGRQADIARTLGVFSQARRSTANRGAQLEAILNEAGGIQNSFELAKSYTALDTAAKRSGLAEKTIGGTVKDVWFSTWINGLLSSPVTHAKNIAGNAFFGAYQIPERAVASVIGKARNFVAGGEEAITLDEIYAQAIGYLQGMREGAEIAGTAFVKNEPTDAFAKIEASRAGADPFDIDMGNSTTGKAMSGALKYWGKFVTMPGRALMAEDEFFKAIGYRMELNALATREATKEYRRLIKAGTPEADAAKQAADLQTRLLTDTPAELDEAARGFSRTVTFTRELEPSLQGAQRLLQNPLAKMFVPFVRTPTNIALEAMSRTPGLNLASPRFWADWDAGGIRRDMAMARVTLGSGILYGVGSYALEGKMTGYGPMRADDKKALEGTGWQQFSFVFNKDDLSFDMLSKFKAITSVREGADKVYVSYAGLEPLSTLLAIASTSGEYSLLTAGEGDMEKLAMGGAMGIYQYMSEQPMLQGVADIQKVFSSKAKDAPTFLYNVMAQLSKQTTSFAIGGSPAGAYSSFVASIERIMNPEKSQVMEAISPQEIGVVSGAAKGYWEALQTACSRNPLCSDRLPRALDAVTGEVKTVGKGNWAEMFIPFRLSDGSFSPAHQALVEYGVPMYTPDKKISGVELSASQYTRWIELATRDGKLADDIVKLTNSSTFIRLAGRDLGMAQDMVSDLISESYKVAKEQLLVEDKELADAVQEVKDLQKDEGKYKR